MQLHETHITFRTFIMAVKWLKSYKFFYQKSSTFQTSFNENFCLTGDKLICMAVISIKYMQYCNKTSHETYEIYNYL